MELLMPVNTDIKEIAARMGQMALPRGAGQERLQESSVAGFGKLHYKRLADWWARMFTEIGDFPWTA